MGVAGDGASYEVICHHFNNNIIHVYNTLNYYVSKVINVIKAYETKISNFAYTLHYCDHLGGYTPRPSSCIYLHTS